MSKSVPSEAELLSAVKPHLDEVMGESLSSAAPVARLPAATQDR